MPRRPAVVMDPEGGQTLVEFLQAAPLRRVFTPVGLEVIHRIDIEDEPVFETILGPRRHVRPAPHYSKPCVVGAGTKIARGGHFTQYDKVHTPDHMYLLHLKFCDFDSYCEAMNRRNQITTDLGGDVKQIAIGRHWFAEARGEDRAVFEAFEALEMQDGFDLSAMRQTMHRSWKARGETGFWQFDRLEEATQYVLPERFNGII